ncbi:hypothetical protein EWM64_g5443 [Hericium alpestre]|uniref:Uncharacterized protein n=1 Tax=Hericium alpestre TaxID=135208 RepID=A0A4Y9ZVK4_9AGAM|nr:hypothetical protein EWM64_g5443 [Hericium alpestre]
MSSASSYTSAASPHPPLSFVFDIQDGVLLRGSTVLPEAKRALTILEGNNPFRTKIPYILPVDFSNTPIRSIFVFHDPRNWALDAQVMVDLIMGGGIIGAPYVHPEKRAPEERVKVVFCNPDLQWGANFSRPRLGQGAFRVAFQAVFKGLTGGEYPYTQYGKPTTATYKFAEDVLRSHYAKVLGRPMEATCNVYMIGDNPESDIAGANATGWSSVLVRTGVYDGSTDPPTHTPTHIADHVEEAVKWAISRELAMSRQEA